MGRWCVLFSPIQINISAILVLFLLFGVQLILKLIKLVLRHLGRRKRRRWVPSSNRRSFHQHGNPLLRQHRKRQQRPRRNRRPLPHIHRRRCCSRRQRSEMESPKCRGGRSQSCYFGGYTCQADCWWDRDDEHDEHDDEYEDEYKHDDIESAHGNLYALFLDGTLCW